MSCVPEQGFRAQEPRLTVCPLAQPEIAVGHRVSDRTIGWHPPKMTSQRQQKECLSRARTQTCRASAAVVDRDPKVEVEAGLAAEGNRSSQHEERCFLLTALS